MPGMSERPFKVEQWSKGFAGITRLILETSTPKGACRIRPPRAASAHAVGTRCDGARRSCRSIRGHRRRN